MAEEDSAAEDLVAVVAALAEVLAEVVISEVEVRVVAGKRRVVLAKARRCKKSMVQGFFAPLAFARKLLIFGAPK